MESIAQLMNKPGVGDIFNALAVLGNSESIAEFKQSKHYNAIKDWSITVHDFESGGISIYPGPKHLKRALAVAAIIGTGIFLFRLRRRRKRNQ